MLAKPLAECTYLSSIVSELRCLSQCVSPKIAILPHSCFPWGRPWGNHAKFCMDGKRIRCLHTNCLAACAHLTITVSEIKRDIYEKIVILSYPLAFDAPVRGVPVGIVAPPFGIEKLEWCRYPMVKKN